MSGRAAVTIGIQKSGMRFLSAISQSVIMSHSEFQNMQNFNSAELRPVEFARAYLQKKMLKKPLREDAGADVLRDSPCSAHVSRKPVIPSARITHR